MAKKSKSNNHEKKFNEGFYIDDLPCPGTFFALQLPVLIDNNQKAPKPKGA